MTGSPTGGGSTHVARIASSALTVFLERSPWEVNRCPIEPEERPPGCPKRDEPDACCAPGELPQR